MAYCVHCGVKLGDSEKRCPLCKTPVFDPAEPEGKAAVPPYPKHTPEQILKKNKRFLLTLAAVTLIVPALLCLVIDALTGGGLTWSLYPAGALVLLFITVAVPLIVPKHPVYATVAVTFVCLNGYLFLVECLSRSGPWFLPIALPALSLGTALLILIILLYGKGYLNKLTVIASAFAAVAVECLAIEWLRGMSRGGLSGFVWSPFVLAPCLFISLALFFVNGNRAVREEVRRRVHF